MDDSKSNSPPRLRGGARGGVPVPWQSSPELWEKLKPLARQMRTEPTLAEKLLWQRLNNKQLQGFKFRRQQVIDRFIVDFYCHEIKLVIEVDGKVHNYTQVEDGIRQEFLESLGLRVLRFNNQDVLLRIEGVLEEIVRWLQ
jgi:very-short-patch-repair endonuclease